MEGSKNKSMKIGITGPECCGKTSLTQRLHRELKLPMVHEYAREYFESRAISNRKETIYHLAQEQIKLENEASALHKVIICDSDLINIKLWLQYYNQPVPDFIEYHLKTNPYSFSLLLYPNIPWESDGIRANPLNRLSLYKQFEAELKRYNIPYISIQEREEARYSAAARAIQTVISKA
tara:strand:+ start:1520 stop:2056 length:537 start_codon:yes stop_codon:yes gene_type:complete